MLILIMIYLVFIGVGLPDSLLGTAWPFMAQDFHADVDRAGILSVIISIGIILSSLAAYRILQKAGFKRSTIAALGSIMIALLGYAAAPSLWVAAGFSLLLGFGGGMLQTIFNGYVAEHYSSKHMNWLDGTWGIGAVIGPLVVSAFSCFSNGWRLSYAAIALVEFILICVAAVVLKNERKHGSTYKERCGKTEAADQAGLHGIRGKGFVFGEFFLYCSMENAIMLWGATYLIGAKGITPVMAAQGVSLFFMGITVGRFISGFLAKRFGNMRLIYISVITSVILNLILLCVTRKPVILIIFLLLGLSMSSIHPGLLYQTPQFYKHISVQKLMGIQVASSYVGILLVPAALGKIFAMCSFDLLPAVEAVFIAGVAVCVYTLKRMSRDSLKLEGMEKDVS